MEFRIKFIFTSFILLAFSGFVFSQSKEISENRLPPYSLQLNLCLNNSILELSGSGFISENIYDGKTFGAGKGFGASVISKITLGKNSGLTFNQSVMYNRMLSYDFGKSQYDIGEAEYNAYTIALGMEFNFFLGGRYIIFGGIEVNTGLINGISKIWFERRGHPLGDSVAKYDFNGSFRMGYGLCFGVEYLLNNQFGLNTGLKFQNLNAFMKQSAGTNDKSEFQIRDDNSPGLIFAGNKNFVFISFCIGLSYNFGFISKNFK